MTTLAEARAAIERYLQDIHPNLSEGDELIILDERTISRAWGWVFFYTSRLWSETGDFRYALAGNAPLIFESRTGRILSTGTALPLENYLARYESTGSPSA